MAAQHRAPRGKGAMGLGGKEPGVEARPKEGKVKEEDLAALCAEPALNAPSRLSVNPGRIAGNVVSCTGAQFCGLAMVETKNNAEDIAKILETRVEVPRANPNPTPHPNPHPNPNPHPHPHPNPNPNPYPYPYLNPNPNPCLNPSLKP